MPVKLLSLYLSCPACLPACYTRPSLVGPLSCVSSCHVTVETLVVNDDHVVCARASRTSARACPVCGRLAHTRALGSAWCARGAVGPTVARNLHIVVIVREVDGLAHTRPGTVGGCRTARTSQLWRRCGVAVCWTLDRARSGSRGAVGSWFWCRRRRGNGLGPGECVPGCQQSFVQPPCHSHLDPFTGGLVVLFAILLVLLGNGGHERVGRVGIGEKGGEGEDDLVEG